MPSMNDLRPSIVDELKEAGCGDGWILKADEKGSHELLAPESIIELGQVPERIKTKSNAVINAHLKYK